MRSMLLNVGQTGTASLIRADNEHRYWIFMLTSFNGVVVNGN